MATEDLWGWDDEAPAPVEDAPLPATYLAEVARADKAEAELAKCMARGKATVEENWRLRDEVNAQKVRTANLGLVEAELERVRARCAELGERSGHLAFTCVGCDDKDRALKCETAQIEQAHVLLTEHNVRATEIGTPETPVRKLTLCERITWLAERVDILRGCLRSVGKPDSWTDPEAEFESQREVDAGEVAALRETIRQLEQWQIRSAEAERGAFTMLLTLRGEGSSIFGTADRSGKVDAEMTPLQTELAGIIERNPDAGEKGLAAVAAPLACTVCGSRGRNNRAHRPPGQTKGPYCIGKRVTLSTLPSTSETSADPEPQSSTAPIAEHATT